MIGRNAVLFSHAPITLEVVATVGVVTALMAGTIASCRTTSSASSRTRLSRQLGYMFLAMGAGGVRGGHLHLYTHAFFRPSSSRSGAVIHALAGQQDLRHMAA